MNFIDTPTSICSESQFTSEFAPGFDEYASDYLTSLYSQETQQRYQVSLKMIELQPEIKWFMRPFLIDFLNDILLELGLAGNPDLIFLTLRIVDSYSAKRIVAKKHLQLIGSVAVWMAIKIIEKKSQFPCSISSSSNSSRRREGLLDNLIHFCCGIYEKQMFIQMESHILQTLDWDLSFPTVPKFLELEYSATHGDTDKVHTLALYVAEVALYHKHFIPFPQSTIARSAALVAANMLNHSAGTTLLTHRDAAEQDCIHLLLKYVNSPTKSLQKKYKKILTHVQQVQSVRAGYITPPQSPFNQVAV